MRALIGYVGTVAGLRQLIRKGGVNGGRTSYIMPNTIPRENALRRFRALSNLTEELQELINHFQEQCPALTSDDIKDALDIVKPE